MKGLSRVLFSVGLGVVVLLSWVSVTHAGVADGDDTNYLNNGEFDNASYWVTDGANIEFSGGLVNSNGSNNRIWQAVFLPTGTVTVTAYGEETNGNAFIEVFDSNGATVDGWDFPNSGANTFVREFDIVSPGVYSFVVRAGSFGTQRWFLDYIRVVVDGEGPETEEPPPPVDGFIELTKAYCLVDTSGNYYSNTITNTTNLSTTETYTVSANFIDNHDFSLGETVPESWDIEPGLYAPSMYTGEAIYHDNLPAATVEQFLLLPASPDGYLFGGFASNVGGQNATVEFGQNGSLLITPTGVVTSLVRFDDIHITSGEQYFTISIPDSTGLEETGITIDDVFAIPVEIQNGEIGVYCPAVKEKEEGTTGGNITEPVDGNPVPKYGAGEICYECNFPKGRGVPSAIAWLACVIRNLFSCSLRIWLYAIENAIMSMIPAVTGGFAWLANTAGGFANFFGEMYNNYAIYLNSQTVFVVAEDEFTWLEFLYELIYLPVALLGGLTDAIYAIVSLIESATLAITVIVALLLLLFTTLTTPLLKIIQLVFVVISAMFQAFAAPPMGLEDFVVATGGNMAEIQAADGGLMYISFLWGVQIVDDFMGHPAVNWVVWMGAALVAIWTFNWVISKWETVIPQSA